MDEDTAFLSDLQWAKIRVMQWKSPPQGRAGVGKSLLV